MHAVSVEPLSSGSRRSRSGVSALVELGLGIVTAIRCQAIRRRLCCVAVTAVSIWRSECYRSGRVRADGRMRGVVSLVDRGNRAAPVPAPNHVTRHSTHEVISASSDRSPRVCCRFNRSRDIDQRVWSRMQAAAVRALLIA